jgi:crotonobetainyl-CoA:carnitine CoA-transferase CaiB-like acyl-CoA transferase
MGALEPKFWAAWCEGVGRPDLVAHQFDAPGSPAHDAASAVFAERTRDAWEAFAAQHDCCLEPVLDLDEVLGSELVQARDMVVEIDQPGVVEPVRQLGVPIKLGRTPADPGRGPGPGLGEHTDDVLAAAGFSDAEIADLHDSGAVAGPGNAVPGSFMH